MVKTSSLEGYHLSKIDVLEAIRDSNDKIKKVPVFFGK